MLITLCRSRSLFCRDVNPNIYFAQQMRHLTTSELREYYALLNVGRDATPQQIRESFLRLSKVYHPDNKLTGSNEKFILLKKAYDAVKSGAPITTNNSYVDSRSSQQHGPSDFSRYNDFTDLNRRSYTKQSDTTYGNNNNSFHQQTPYEHFIRNNYRKGGDYMRPPDWYQDHFRYGYKGRSIVGTTVFLSSLCWFFIVSCTFYLMGDSEERHLAVKEAMRRNQELRQIEMDFRRKTKELQRRKREVATTAESVEVRKNSPELEDAEQPIDLAAFEDHGR